MKKKRMVKLLMSVGCDRNDAARAAERCDGEISHEWMLRVLYWEFIDTYRKAQKEYILKGDATGHISGILGSHPYG